MTNEEFIRFDIVPFSRGRGIQVMSEGISKLYPHFVGVDNDQHFLFASKVMEFVITYNADRFDISWLRVVKDKGFLISCQEKSILEIVPDNWAVIVNKKIAFIWFNKI